MDKTKDVTRGVYGDMLRRKAAAVSTDSDEPSMNYMAVRNARRRAQFYARWHNNGVNVVGTSGKVEVRGENPDLYVA